jgi:HD-GYP domain-containing protein (c-di-GMP phosphodiesterase class II)
MGSLTPFTTRRFQLQVYIATLFLGLIGLFSVAILTMEYQKAREIMRGAAETRFNKIEDQISSDIELRYDFASFALSLLADSTIATAPTLAARLERLPMFVQILRDRPLVRAVKVGYDSGDFFLVRRFVPNGRLAKLLEPPAATAYVVQSGERGAVGDFAIHYLFFDQALTPLGERTVPGDVMDPRTRPWFQAAEKEEETVVTQPYALYTTQETTTTVARRVRGGHSVVAIDILLAGLTKRLRAMRPTPSAEIAIMNDAREVLAASDLTDEDLADDVPDVNQTVFGTQHGGVIAKAIAEANSKTQLHLFPIENFRGTETYDASVSRLTIRGAPLYLVIAAPARELLADAISLRNRGLLTALLVVLISIPLTLFCSRLASRPLGGLTREAAAIRALKFDEPTQVHSFIAEIDVLARTMGSMKSTIRRFLEIGAALAGERRFERLIDYLLVQMMEITGARGGAVYLSERDGALKCSLAHWGSVVCETSPPDLQPERDTDHPVIKALAGNALVAPLSSEDLARWYPDFESSGPSAALAVALRNRQGIIVGALMLVQDRGAQQEVQEHEILTMVEALAGTAATAIENQLLYLEQKELLEALIQLVAGAIDRKSPYTGGHCERVPELVKMIAHAAEDATTGPFKDFALSEDQWETLHIAAWLHDCGKVTTPEYVVDKATKLETIYDRLHEVRMRFEVVKREAEVACWQAIAGGEPSAGRLAELRALWEVLDEEFAFVAECNEGGEFMAPDKVERLRRIGGRTWTRTLDDRIGLGPEEQKRKNDGSAAALPVKEALLADKPDHIVVRDARDSIASDNPWGFKIPVPEHLYNRGEIHNLAIGRGTLSDEDRYKINEHIVETIRMLSRLPWPRHLDQVVEFAGGHHERMDGKGYPRQLLGREMSLPARMMAVADIFEALTAGDRPYKKAKSLSQALGIMAHMRDEGHIDREIFELFVSAGVYETYAARYLDREQIDAVDPARYFPDRQGDAMPSLAPAPH